MRGAAPSFFPWRRLAIFSPSLLCPRGFRHALPLFSAHFRLRDHFFRRRSLPDEAAIAAALLPRPRYCALMPPRFTRRATQRCDAAKRCFADISAALRSLMPCFSAS